ncbi:MAG: hypothetical protein K6G51_01710 [Sphaerochaetaceae bacterium]|nr:hypothetical protein [Sphaerochaetaceae bacterium]
MNLMVYIFPAALFVLTMIILFILRGEDSKSRTLKNINDTLLNFRSEANQTTKRIQEATHDCLDSIDRKRNETNQIIDDINKGLMTLERHRDDLISLEGICKSYEDALSNLRVQTERAEEKVNQVKQDVITAEGISQSIHAFEVSSENIKKDLAASEESYRLLCERTERDFTSIVESHRKSEEEMLTLFSDELDRKRDDFSGQVNSIFATLDDKRGDIDTYVVEIDNSLEEKKNLFSESVDQGIENINKKIEDAEKYIEAQNADLKSWKQEFDEYFEQRRADNKASEESYQSNVEKNMNILEELDKKLVAELEETHNNIQKVLTELKAEYEESLNSEKASYEQRVEDMRNSLEERNTEIVEGANAKVEEVRNSVNVIVDEAKISLGYAKSDIDNHSDELKNNFETSLKNYNAEKEELFTKINSSIETLENKNDEIAKNTELLKSSADEKLNSFNEDVKASIEKARDSVSAHTDEMIKRIGDSGDATIKVLDNKSEDVRANVDKTCEEAKNLHSQQLDLIQKAEKEFENNCRKALSDALSEEVSEIGKVLEKFSASAIENINNLGKSQSDFKEAVSWLNQGVGETIANAVDRLQDLQKKLLASETRLEETNESVTRTKEELLDLQKDHREWQTKVDKMISDIEEADHRFKAIKQQRINEEGKLVKLKMEVNSYEEQLKSEVEAKRGNVGFDVFPDDIDGSIL